MYYWEPIYCNQKCACFEQGQILLVPFHVTNRDPSLSVNDRELTLANAGPVFSKYRPVVVFRKFQTQMECLPFYTNKGKGVTRKTDEEKEEWIPVVEASGADSPGALTWSVYGRGQVKKNSHLHITESVTVEYTENVRWLGKMTQSSFEHLQKLRAEQESAVEERRWGMSEM